jgi:UDP-glucose 4-epimerase
MAVEAQTAYETSKLARERYAEYYANHHDMNMAGLRFFVYPLGALTEPSETAP